ncbi:MAG: CoA-binding protein, partial [Patescibacteria group bacterium]
MSWKLFDPTTPILIQGITGKEGARMTRWLVASGANVVGGVTPGKGGQLVEGKPVFDSVAALHEKFSDTAVSSIVVPAPRVLGAVEEAIAAGVTHIHLLTENVPVHDVRRMRDMVAHAGATLLGPSSIGYLQFPRFRVGYLGGESPFDSLKEGGVAVISTSGGMTNELMMSLAREGIGI